jgi:sugar lactone lactonase YvrE
MKNISAEFHFLLRFLVIIAAALYLISCGGGGGGSVIYVPGDPNDVQGDITITTHDGNASATFAKDLFTADTEIHLTNILAGLAAEGLPESRHAIAAVEFVVVTNTKSASQDTGTGDQTEPVTDPSDIGGSVELNLLLSNSIWPAASTIQLYKWSSSILKWEETGITALVDSNARKATATITKFGRYALMSPLSDELPPPEGVFVKLVAATKTAVILDWPASDYEALAGYNLYTSTAEDGVYTKVNSELLLEPGYRQVGVEPGVYFYYVTLVNTGNLEGAPGPVTSVEVMGTDYLTVFGNYGSPDDPLEKPMDIAVLPLTGEVVVVDEVKKRLAVYSPMGVFKREIGTNVINGPDFGAPIGIGVAFDGKSVYVADSGKDRVVIMNENLNVKSTFGGTGTSEGYLTSPTDVAINSDGIVFVTDTGNNRIQYYSPSGTYLGMFGNTGSEDELLLSPTFIVATPENRLYVNDSGNNRIVKYTSDLAFDGTVAFSDMGSVPPLELAAGLTIDEEGRLYVADCGRNRIITVTSTGVYDYLFGSGGYEHGEFGDNSPQGLAFDPITGLLYASDTANKRIEVFQP